MSKSDSSNEGIRLRHFLFPAGSAPNIIDEMYVDQNAALVAAGFTTSNCADSVLAGAQRLRGIPPGSTVIYRGWMLTSDEYAVLIRAIEEAEGKPLTSLSEYLLAHHMPNWYPLIAEFTPETRVFSPEADLVAELKSLNWGTYFIKDFVKSLKVGRGSIARDLSEVSGIISEMQEYRGRIEGGYCVRRVEDFDPETEERYFVVQGKAFATAGDAIPEIVQICSQRIPSKFFSVDVIRRRDGQLRVVEIGDGQVSDIVGWTAESFAKMWVSQSGTCTC